MRTTPSIDEVMAASILQDFAPIAESNANPNGYWGAITSSVDWCEINYHVSSYLCEFFNSFSSVAMVLVGVLGYFLQHGLLEARFVVAMCMISVVGMGSFAFHATLKHETQMLDEVPMLWNALSLLYIITENEHASKPKYGFWFPLSLTLYGVVTSLLVALTNGLLQFCAFHVSFATLEFYCLYQVYQMNRRYSNENQAMRTLFNYGFYTFLIALVCWQLDINFCSTLQSLPLGIPNPQFHAWWHILVSVGLYDLTIFIVYRRQQVLYKKGHLVGAPDVKYVFGLVPYVSL